MKSNQPKKALVIGGSMAGLLTARVLSDHFEQVTLVERDQMQDLPESRKGQPQTRHIHGLLARGFQVMTHLFPDLKQELQQEGSLIIDGARTMNWYTYGAYRTRFDLGIDLIITDRCILEWKIRQSVMALPNVEVLDGFAVDNLVTENNNQQVIGVEVIQVGEKNNICTIPASLVVDCSGRGSRSPKWLEILGYSKPPESAVTCGAGYSTRIYEREPDDPQSKEWIFITPEAPKEYRGGGAFPLEGNRWIVSLGGWHGDHAPKEEEGFLDFARSLPAPDVYNIVSRSKPLSDIYIYKFPASLRRYYEKIKNFPQGYLVLGDAVCSFNPLYGQGMTTAALQAEVLDLLLKERNSEISNIAKPFFKRVAKIINVPWQTAVGEDFRFPETTGKKAIGTDFINWYVSQIHKATHHDPIVGATFLKAMGMIEPPSALFQPHIMCRVLQSNLRNRKKYLTPTG